MNESATFYELLDNFSKMCHANSKAHGFWEGPDNDNVPTKIALMHSELSEMLEAYRAGNPPCPKKVGDNLIGLSCMEEECADLFIRLCDFTYRHGIDLGRIALVKHRYNVDRPFRHGKKV